MVASDPSETLRDAFVALDTNVLLLPYKMKEWNRKAILDSHRTLAEWDQLVIPGHVAGEFTRGRIESLANLYQRINDVKSKAVPTVPGEAALFADTDEFEELRQTQVTVADALGSYKKSLTCLAKRVLQFPDHDPI